MSFPFWVTLLTTLHLCKVIYLFTYISVCMEENYTRRAWHFFRTGIVYLILLCIYVLHDSTIINLSSEHFHSSRSKWCNYKKNSWNLFSKCRNIKLLDTCKCRNIKLLVTRDEQFYFPTLANRNFFWKNFMVSKCSLGHGDAIHTFEAIF